MTLLMQRKYHEGCFPKNIFIMNDIDVFLKKSAQLIQMAANVRDIFLIAPKNFFVNELAAPFAGDANFSVVSDQNRIFIKELQQSEFVSAEKSEEISAYYDDEEGNIFRDQIPDPDFYIIEFKSIEFLKQVLRQSMNRSDVFLDNDFGLILSGTQFLSVIEQRPSWDWAFE